MNSKRKNNRTGPMRQDLPAAATQSESPAGSTREGKLRGTGARRSRTRKLFEAAAKPFDAFAEPAGDLRAPSWPRRVRGALAFAVVVTLGFVVAAQETNAPAQTRAMVPTTTSVQASEPARPDYSTFKMIADRNIFDPNRYPRMGPRSRQRRTDSFALVGTMSYAKGTFAFFDGTSPEYKKALRATGEIAGYKVTNIARDSVKLASGTNELELPVGVQMRRDDEGDWSMAAHTELSVNSNAPSASDAESASAPGGAENDIVKKMMQRREQELNR